MFPYLIQGNNIVITLDNETHTIAKTHVAYDRIKEAIKNSDWDTVRKTIKPEKVVLEYGQGRIAVQGEKVFWDGHEMHNALTTRMIAMLQEDFPITPLVLFMERLMTNPSFRAVNELYAFLERNNLPITPDGHFLAYKKVKDDYTDVHSGTVLNKPAYLFTDEEKAAMPMTSGKKKEVSVFVDNENTIVAMPRNMVDDDKNRTCSEGLHFCSKEYLDHFGGDRVVILKINPRDVVSIPVDYGFSKGRTARYEIIGELGVNPDEAFTKPVQATANAAE